MLGSVEELRGFRVEASDGEIGKVADVFFDDASWSIRYVVVDTGGWLTGRQVLLSPVSLGRPDQARKLLPVRLTRAQVENSPPVESDQPVSRQHEALLAAYYGWPSYWGVEPLYPPAPLPLPPFLEPPERQGDPHLRSAHAVAGYGILATDGEIGHLKDFLADDHWTIKYLVVETGHWLRGRKVLLEPRWIREVDWTGRRVAVERSQEDIRTSPEFE